MRAPSGYLLAARYRLVEPVGRGGMGTVWRAHDELLDRDVAVKEVRLPTVLDEELRAELCARTEREGRATAMVAHPSVITVFDVVTEDDRPWIVMELLRAKSLEQLIQEDGPLHTPQGRRDRPADPGGAARRARQGHPAPRREAQQRAGDRGPRGAHRLRPGRAGR
ncbi:protein kinase [Nonomuraea thailandensis]